MRPMSALRAWLITDPLIVIATVFFASVSLLISLFDRSGRRQASVAAAWSRVLLSVSGVKVTTAGRDKISPSGSYVFSVSRNQSEVVSDGTDRLIEVHDPRQLALGQRAVVRLGERFEHGGAPAIGA